MLVAEISDQLGNQMFAYASVKSIALKNGYDFGFARAPNNQINDTDKKYGCEIHTVFPNTLKEFHEVFPPSVINEYVEVATHLRKTNWQKSATQVLDNTFMRGHFISTNYFEDNIDQVRTWFTFPSDIVENVIQEINEIYDLYPDSKIYGVHFRINKEYLTQGRKISDSYWKKAARKIAKKEKKSYFLAFW